MTGGRRGHPECEKTGDGHPGRRTVKDEDERGGREMGKREEEEKMK